MVDWYSLHLPLSSHTQSWPSHTPHPSAFSLHDINAPNSIVKNYKIKGKLTTLHPTSASSQRHFSVPQFFTECQLF